MDTRTSLPTQSRPVWDIFVRLFHWSLAGSILFAWWSAEQGGSWMNAHMYAGYLVLSLVLFRLIWGVIGSPYARFGQFIKSPAATLVYGRNLLSGQHAHYVGHNPLGGWMVLALLLICAVQAGTGLFATDDIFTEGPLTSWVSSSIAGAITGFHKFNFNLLMTAVVLHLAGVVYHQRFKREPLVQAMLHGRKPVAELDYAGVPAALWKGVIAVALAAALFWTLASL